MPSASALSASNLSCTRGENELFNGLDFAVQAGQCLHITGPNGCGKTSLLRIACGLNTSDTGGLQWNSHNIVGNSEYLKQSAYIAHKDGLKNELTAIENLRFYQQLDNVHDETALDDALAKMQILKCADLPAQSLSFGQRRRLAFARLLTCDFKLWILDEPFTGVDIAGRDLIENLCVEHLMQRGLIIMTHHQSLENSALAPYHSELKLGPA